MVLFTIACETCASRLHVKQPSAIGQVLACPKCGSMVHVQPPEGWEMPESPDAPARVPKPPRDPDDSQATLSAEFGKLRDEAPAAAPQKRKPMQQQAAPAAAVLPADAPPVQDAVDALPPNHWGADGTNQRGKALVWIASIIGICLVALVLILYMVSKMIGNPNVADNESEQTEKTEVVDSADADKDAAAKDPDQPKENDLVDADTGEAKADDDKSTNSKTDDATPTEPPENPDESNDPANTDDKTDEPPGDMDDPLDPDAALEESIAMEQEQDNRSVLDDFSGIGDLVFNPGIDMDEFREATSDDQTHKFGIGKVYVPVPRELKVDPARAIEEAYPGLAYKDQALIEFTRNLFSLMQVPVQLDGQAVIEGRLDPQALINASGKEVSPTEILRQALEPLDLVWRWNTDNSIIIITPRPSDEIVATEIELDPALAISSAETAEKLIAGIQLVIEPGSWNVNAGPGTIKFADGKLQLEQTTVVTGQVQSLIDKLVLAAKLRANTGDLTLEEQLATVYERSNELLAGEGSVYSLQRQPLQHLLNQLASQDGLTVLVNWDEAASENWNPNVTIPWLSEGEAMGTTIRDLTNSMGLAFRRLDGSTIEITSKQKFWSATRLEVFPCNKQLQNRFSGQQIIEFIKEGILADLPQGGHTPVVFSPNYNCIVAVLPDPLHIKVEKILQQLAERK